MNTTCSQCPLALNCINGRYCTRLHAYVQYDNKPKCKQYDNC